MLKHRNDGVEEFHIQMLKSIPIQIVLVSSTVMKSTKWTVDKIWQAMIYHQIKEM